MQKSLHYGLRGLSVYNIICMCWRAPEKCTVSLKDIFCLFGVGKLLLFTTVHSKPNRNRFSVTNGIMDTTK